MLPLCRSFATYSEAAVAPNGFVFAKLVIALAKVNPATLCGAIVESRHLDVLFWRDINITPKTSRVPH
jgi:hypothetical protein